MNFVSRYVQISHRAFRYFRNQYEASRGKPIVAFRKNIISAAKPYKVNKASYLKRGSKIAQSGEEDLLFDQMFEIELNENYEDNYDFRNIERAEKEAKDREIFRNRSSFNAKGTNRSKSSSLVQVNTEKNRNHTNFKGGRNHNGFPSQLSFDTINN